MVGRTIFEGNSHVADVELRKNLKLTEGRFWDEETVQRDKKQVIKAYSPLGYIYEQPTVASDQNPDYLDITTQRVFTKQPGKVDLVYVIREGRPFHVGEVRPKGEL